MCSKKYRNKKNGNIYEVIREDVMNCTNVNDGQVMVLYTCEKCPEKIFVREINEFNVKFEKIN